MPKIILAAFATLALTAPAFAENVVLTEPLQAASLHIGGSDMVAYHTRLDDGAVEVTAMYRPHGMKTPQRVMMQLNDHDEVSFSLPFDLSTSYTFARVGDTVTISGTPTSLVQIASR